MLANITAEDVNAFSSVIVALAAAFAAWQGIRNLSAWREQTVGTRKIDLAETALIQLYEIEHALRVIRSPLGDATESADRDKHSDESQAQRHARDIAHVSFKRMREYHETFAAFRITSLKVRAIFGEKLYSQFEEMQKCWREVSVAAHMLSITPYEGFIDLKFKQSLEKQIWHLDDEEAAIHVRVAKAISCAERLLRPHLKS